jgi:hypothetical protein
MIVLVAPTAVITALTVAYRIRQHVARAAVPKAAEQALKPIGYTLIFAGLLCLGYAAWIVHKSDPLAQVLTGVVEIAAGVLIARGSLGAARLVGWLSAASIAVAVGQTLSAPLRMPLGLLQAKLHLETMDTITWIVLFFVSTVLCLWVTLAVRAPAILAARKAAGRSTARPWTGFAVGALLVGNEIIGLALLRSGDLTAEAERRARAKHGASYSYHVTFVGVGERDHRVYAQVIGYNAQAVIDADVDWEQ